MLNLLSKIVYYSCLVIIYYFCHSFFRGRNLQAPHVGQSLFLSRPACLPFWLSHLPFPIMRTQYPIRFCSGQRLFFSPSHEASPRSPDCRSRSQTPLSHSYSLLSFPHLTSSVLLQGFFFHFTAIVPYSCSFLLQDSIDSYFGDACQAPINPSANVTLPWPIYAFLMLSPLNYAAA